MKRCVRASLSFLLCCFLAISIQILYFSPISPDLLEMPPDSASALRPNKLLQEVVKLGEGLVKGPEDIWVDRDGVLYTASRDGWIKKMHKDGTWESWKKIDSDSLLGLTITKDGNLIVCDAIKGLLMVSDDGVKVIASHVNGSKISFADEVIEASDGSLYFSAVSTKFGLHNWYLDVLEAKPHGQLLRYDPFSNETSILLDGLCFPNGVAISKEEDYLAFCETWKFRCRKYWLKGEKQGTTEVFIHNLPAGPDNINLAPDGSFWIALLQLTTPGLEFLHTSTLYKRFVASFPMLINFVDGTRKKAMVVNVAPDGNIIRNFDDPEGIVMSMVTSAFEFEDHLYLGSLNTNFIGKIPLKAAYN
ncbi:hypothetical protein K2173_017526 [Erythroxylum novogranatense]|uniref:Strictosidine synthase conserved region domain-containing protein n=1 Tax=Erythroxylum novogranatense TaxID=1862640 RepID=A0AAV8TKM5_9ROSI|nr:hypothetical protein K2173_017526 [Erythroxylum novogranatense]